MKPEIVQGGELPSTEEGFFTSFPNDRLEALMSASAITRAESQVILSIVRLTFGFQKEEAPISIAWLGHLTGLPRRSVSRCLASLQGKNVVSSTGYQLIDGQKVSVWKVAPPSTWKVVTTRTPPVVTARTLPSAEGSDRTDPKVVTARSDIKETKKRKEEKKRRSASADVRFEPLKEFLFSDYKRIKGMSLNPVFNGSDGKALKDMLKDLPDTHVEVLQSAWTAFLLSHDKFYRKMHGSHPVRYWASNVNAFLELASHGSQAGHSQLSTHNAKVGRDWLSRAGAE